MQRLLLLQLSRISLIFILFVFLLSSLSGQGNIKYITFNGIVPMLSAKYYCEEIIDNRIDTLSIGSNINPLNGRKNIYKLKGGFESQIERAFKGILPFKKNMKPITIVVHNIQVNSNKTHFTGRELCSMELEFIINDGGDVLSYGIFKEIIFTIPNDYNLDTYGAGLTSCFVKICNTLNKTNWKTKTTYKVDTTKNIHDVKLSKVPNTGCYLSFGQMKRGQKTPNASFQVSEKNKNKPNSGYTYRGNSNYAGFKFLYLSNGKDIFIKSDNSSINASYLKILEYGRFLYFETVGRLNNLGFVIDSFTGEISEVNIALFSSLLSNNNTEIFKKYKNSDRNLAEKRKAIQELNIMCANLNLEKMQKE